MKWIAKSYFCSQDNSGWKEHLFQSPAKIRVTCGVRPAFLGFYLVQLFYTSITESDWPLKFSELSGPGSSGAFRESFETETGGLAAHAKGISMRISVRGDIQGETGSSSEREVVCRAWQRWKWTYRKPSWAVRGRFIPQHKWLPLGACGCAVPGGRCDVGSGVGLPCPVPVHGKYLFWEIMPQVSDLIISALETFYHTWDNPRLTGWLLEESSCSAAIITNY